MMQEEEVKSREVGRKNKQCLVRSSSCLELKKKRGITLLD